LGSRPSDGKKKGPTYDWTGARPDEPYERPRDLVTTSTTPFDEEEPFVPLDDDLSEYTEEDEDKPRPVTGVPCAAWTMLAMGAAAGGAAATGTGPQAAAQASSMAANPNQGTTTNVFYPDNNQLPACATDPTCNMVMDGLSPYLPPDVIGLFDIPGTCQSKSRDWLRTNINILEFKSERIRQRYAMSMFFCALDGGDWISNESWISDIHECDWFNRVGLDPCNRLEQMEMIRVPNNGLAGELPMEMFIASNLYEFNVANNLLDGTIPQFFDYMVELDTLVLPFNQFEGTIPDIFFTYKDLVYWDIGFNNFSGTLAADIDTKLPNLSVVFLENNNLSGVIPDNLGNILTLTRLHLDDNNLIGTIPSTLGQPQRMSELRLHGNKLTGVVPAELGGLNRLKELTLHYNSLDEQALDPSICEQMYTNLLSVATVDANIACECCSPGEESPV